MFFDKQALGEYGLKGTEMVQVTLLRRSLASSLYPNALVDVNKGMWPRQAVKLCSNKTLCF